MPISDVLSWIQEFERPGATWYAKRLSANDTLATNAHQAGPYIPKEFLFEVFPSLNRPDLRNPDLFFHLYIDSHSDHRKVRAVWYNNGLGEGTRNETRLTNFGGASSALLDPESTGALTVFAFVPSDDDLGVECHVWVCGGEGVEADVFEEQLGPVEPKIPIKWKPGQTQPGPAPSPNTQATIDGCSLTEEQMPSNWITKFPTGKEIISKAIEMRNLQNFTPDDRLVKRRICEYELFQSVEKVTYLPMIREGFGDINEFLSLANSILQSRKARSGKSLEYHIAAIFEEDGLEKDVHFAHEPKIENNKRPDFLFPSLEAYNTSSFPESKLRMLAAKTTCKDRWRQILNEADRIPNKHLLTLQEGVSQNQFNEMCGAGVTLVVPRGLHSSYPQSVRPYLVTFEEFITDIRLLPNV